MKPLPQENHASVGDADRRPCRYADLSRIAYRQAWELQLALVAARRDGRLDCDVLLLLEHQPVFTLGRRGGLENLCVAESFLAKKAIDIVPIERGGDITYHGPGQLVGYPIVDLRSSRLSVVDYVGKLEEIMIRTASDFGVAAHRDDRNRGVWTGDRKLGSIGIAVRRGISFHGFALNVNTDLEPFGWVNPCGLQGVSVTSLSEENGQVLPMNQVRKAASRHFEAVLNYKLEAVAMTQLETYAKHSSPD
jgi:lipoate-protein ligase B